MFTWVITFTNNTSQYQISVNRNSIDEALEYGNNIRGTNWILKIERKEK